MCIKTKYFQNCLGVFQGGGCKGAAYVGAFKACIQHGISFSEVVGASAGSIIAVFIAAGATPLQLEEIIRDLDFKKFLNPPEKLDVKGSNLLKYSRGLLPQKYKLIPIIVNSLGLYNSKYIEDFVDENLRTLLKKDTKVKFKDLLIPCSLIVSDLASNDSKVFSSDLTPEDDVARAVRCSSNIPIFFQPIDNRYVDGGMLSNLPIHLFKDRNTFHSKVLAFLFKSDNEEVPIDSILNYGKSLINTTLLGNLNIQLELSNNSHFIYIDTVGVKATDFEKINNETVTSLIDNGTKSVNEFVKNEVAYINTKQNRADINIDFFDTNNIITYSGLEKNNEIIISDTQTDWVYDLFPTIIRWAENKTRIRVLLKKNNDDENHGMYRQRFLKYIGAEIVYSENIPFSGIVFDGTNHEKAKAIVKNREIKKQQVFHSKYYHGKEDYDVIKLLQDSLSQYFYNEGFGNTDVSYSPIIKTELIQKLQNVKQYESENIVLDYEEINISDLTFITKYVRGYKFRQIQNVFDVYKSVGVKLFSPVKVNLSDGKSTLITPPIIEKHGDNYYVIEGNTRLTYLNKIGVQKITTIVVNNVIEGLPSSGRYRINELLITDKEAVGKDRYNEFDYEKFRKIEKAVRDPKTCLL